MIRILINTGSNVLLIFVKLVITLIMTPVLVHNLGNYDYGIWEIIIAVIGYMGLLDIGMKPAIARFAAKYHASGDEQRLRELYSTSWVFLLLVGMLLCVFFVSWGLLWPHSLAESGEYTSRYSLLLIIVGAQLLVTFPGYVAESFLEGFQKYYLMNNITIFNSVVSSVILYHYIDPGNALVLLAVVNATGISIKYFAFIYILTRPEYGNMRPGTAYAVWQSFRETVGFGVKSLIQGIASRIEIGTDMIVIGYFLGPAMVPFYAIPSNLISYIRNIGWTLTHAFMPVFSAMDATNRVDDIRELYLGASRYVVAFLLPMCVGVTLVGSAFIGIWIGEEYQDEADIIILLLVVYTSLPFLNPFSTRYLTAIGKHGLLAKLYPVSALINIVASVILVHYWGIAGVALGSVIPVFMLVPIVLKHCCGYLGIPVSQYLVKSVVPSIAPTACMWYSVYTFRQYQPLDSYLRIIMAVLVGAVVYGILFYILGMKTGERKWINSRLARMLPWTVR
ncbi:MAG: oligosaccharide flippase family protein [Pseudomonadota bacterium]